MNLLQRSQKKNQFVHEYIYKTTERWKTVLANFHVLTSWRTEGKAS